MTTKGMNMNNEQDKTSQTIALVIDDIRRAAPKSALGKVATAEALRHAFLCADALNRAAASETRCKS